MIGAKMREWAERMEQQLNALRLALTHPRTPRLCRWMIVLTLLYFVSPVDLIPDFIPVLGQLDDLLIVPLGLWLSVRMIPKEVWIECVERAQREHLERPPKDWRGLLLVAVLWLILAGVAFGIWWQLR